jgi:phi13 family phage major tail protein
MAVFGAQYPCFAAFKNAETPEALPTYDTGVVLGELVSANMTVNLNSAEIYGDDKLIEKVDGFESATVALETVDMTDEVAALLFGATVETGGELTFTPDDTPPYGGLAYYKATMRGGVIKYKCYFFPKAKAALGNDNVQTKGSSITFQPTTTTFTITAPLKDESEWMVTNTVDTVAAAKTWIQGKVNITPPSPPAG